MAEGPAGCARCRDQQAPLWGWAGPPRLMGCAIVLRDVGVILSQRQLISHHPAFFCEDTAPHLSTRQHAVLHAWHEAALAERGC